jgi:hypothetical protein
MWIESVPTNHQSCPSKSLPYCHNLLQSNNTGAAVAGGIAGLVIGGPLLGVVAAGGCAWAVTNQGQAGKVARAGGEAAAGVGDQVKKIKVKRAVTKGCKWASNHLTPKQRAAESSNVSKPVY